MIWDTALPMMRLHDVLPTFGVAATRGARGLASADPYLAAIRCVFPVAAAPTAPGRQPTPHLPTDVEMLGHTRPRAPALMARLALMAVGAPSRAQHSTPGRPRLPRRELTAILLSEAVSVVGDQIARVALAFLVFSRTHSPALSAATIAVSYLPWAVAAPLLSGLGDRYPRRRVMVCSEVYRMAVCAALTVPRAPIALLLILLFFLTCGEPPFRSARNALYPDVFGEDGYVRGQSLIQSVSAGMQFTGYALGGLVVAAAGGRGALALDSATFGISAIALRTLLRHRPAPTITSSAAVDGSRTGWSIVWNSPVARSALAVGVIVQALDTVAVGLAVPWARQLGHGAELAGLLIAASVLGGTVGNLALAYVREERKRLKLVTPLALLLFALLTPLVLITNPAVSLFLLFAAGLCSCLQLVVQQTFILAIPADARSRAGGVAGTCLNLGQGAAVLIAGGLATGLRPSTVVGLAGLLGLFILLADVLRSAINGS